MTAQSPSRSTPTAETPDDRNLRLRPRRFVGESERRLLWQDDLVRHVEFPGARPGLSQRTLGNQALQGGYSYVRKPGGPSSSHALARLLRSKTWRTFIERSEEHTSE